MSQIGISVFLYFFSTLIWFWYASYCVKSTFEMHCIPIIMKYINSTHCGPVMHAVWQHGPRSELTQVMVWCLMTLSHYLNQCWFIISKVQWHLSTKKKKNSREMPQSSITKMSLKITYLNFIQISPGPIAYLSVSDICCELKASSVWKPVLYSTISLKTKKTENIIFHWDLHHHISSCVILPD